MFVLAGRRHEFAAAISDVAAWTLVATVGLQIGALVARSEAWHLSIQAAGGTVARRLLYRASSMQVLGAVPTGSWEWPHGSRRCVDGRRQTARRCRR